VNNLSLTSRERDLICRTPRAAVLRGHILGYRGFRFRQRDRRRRLVVPDGIVKVMLGFGEPLRMVDAVNPRRLASAASLVNGPRTTAVVGQHHGMLYGITIMLTPLAAFRILGVPMRDFTGQDVTPDAVLGPAVRILVGRLADCPDWDSRFGLLDDVLATRLLAGPQFSPEVSAAWCRLHATSGGISIDALAAYTGWSRRHLERRFHEQVGLSPKATAQVIRLQAALRLKEQGLANADVACALGFHDQAHYDHTFKAMIGCTPTEFSALRAGADPGDPLDFLPDRVTSVLLGG
jgi:AraC-like DNA-binding protein